MPIVPIDPLQPDPGPIAAAAAALRAGELVVFPTETVYGLGAAALDERALARIFAAKRRPSHHPLIVHVPDAAAGRELASEWPGSAADLAAIFWPGPLTLVVAKRDCVPDLATAGLPSVALRAPAHPVAQALLLAAAIPIAAPSANRHQHVSPTTAAHVARSLDLREVAYVLDAGPTPIGIESTVVELTGPRPRLLRLGGIERAAIEAIVGPLELVSSVDADRSRTSPGLAARHYSPDAEILFVEALDSTTLAGPRPLGAIVRRSTAAGALDHVLELPDDPAGYARLLYAALHTLDELGCARILIEALPAGDEWAAVRDRLARAAHSPTTTGVPASAS